MEMSDIIRLIRSDSSFTQSSSPLNKLRFLSNFLKRIEKRQNKNECFDGYKIFQNRVQYFIFNLV